MSLNCVTAALLIQTLGLAGDVVKTLSGLVYTTGRSGVLAHNRDPPAWLPAQHGCLLDLSEEGRRLVLWVGRQKAFHGGCGVRGHRGTDAEDVISMCGCLLLHFWAGLWHSLVQCCSTPARGLLSPWWVTGAGLNLQLCPTLLNSLAPGQPEGGQQLAGAESAGARICFGSESLQGTQPNALWPCLCWYLWAEAGQPCD